MTAYVFYLFAPIVLGALFFVTLRIIVFAMFWGWQLLIEYLRSMI